MKSPSTLTVSNFVEEQQEKGVLNGFNLFQSFSSASSGFQHQFGTIFNHQTQITSPSPVFSNNNQNFQLSHFFGQPFFNHHNNNANQQQTIGSLPTFGVPGAEMSQITEHLTDMTTVAPQNTIRPTTSQTTSTTTTLKETTTTPPEETTTTTTPPLQTTTTPPQTTTTTPPPKRTTTTSTTSTSTTSSTTTPDPTLNFDIRLINDTIVPQTTTRRTIEGLPTADEDYEDDADGSILDDKINLKVLTSSVG